jgi:large subunit ribosomal protein L6
MSRIGKKPVAIPSGVTVEVKGSTVKVQGSKGEMNFTFLPCVTVKVEGSEVIVERDDNQDNASAVHGLTRQLISNMIQGVSQGFEKRLEIIGVGYKAQAKGKTLALSLGFSHPVNYPVPAGIEITQEEKNQNILIIRGVDKQLVGQTAAVIRSMRPPEPYKGKGVRYVGEAVRRKAGKAAAAKGSA